MFVHAKLCIEIVIPKVSYTTHMGGAKQKPEVVGIIYKVKSARRQNDDKDEIPWFIKSFPNQDHVVPLEHLV